MTRISIDADGPPNEVIDDRATKALADDTDDTDDDIDDEELLSSPIGLAHATRDASPLASPSKRAREGMEPARDDDAARSVRARACEAGDARGVVDVIDLVETDDDDDDDDDDDVGKASPREETIRRPPAPYEEEARMILAQELADIRAAAAARASAAATVASTSTQRAPCVGSAKTMFFEITAVLDDSLNTDVGYGKAVKNAFEAGTTDGKSVAIMHVFENLPLKSSITWRYHQPSTDPVGRDDSSARSAEYTALLLSAPEFVTLLENDHAKFHVMMKDFRRVNREPNHKLCVIVNGFHDYCVQRERKEAYKGLNAFRQRDFDFSLATICAQYQNVALVSLPRMVSSIDHVVTLHKNLAASRYEPKKTLLDIVGGKTTARFDDGISRGAGGGERRKDKTSADIFFAALMKIPGVSESIARGIVQQHRTMMDLMNIYADPTASDSYKKTLLADVLAVASTGKGQPRRIGPVVSERLYNIFRPWPQHDGGGSIFSRH